MTSDVRCCRKTCASTKEAGRGLRQEEKEAFATQEKES